MYEGREGWRVSYSVRGKGGGGKLQCTREGGVGVSYSVRGKGGVEGKLHVQCTREGGWGVSYSVQGKGGGGKLQCTREGRGGG